MAIAGFGEQARNPDVPAARNGAAVLVAVRLEPVRAAAVVLDHRCAYDPLWAADVASVRDELIQLPIG